LTLLGIDEYRKDIFIGLLFGGAVIGLNILGLFSMALPPVASVLATNAGRFLAIVLIAPVIEESLFRGVLLALGSENTKSFLFANGMQAAIFGLFHLAVYSGIFLEQFSLKGALVVGGAFISAIIFGFAAGFVAKKTNNLLPVIIGHSMINLWLVAGTLVII